MKEKIGAWIETHKKEIIEDIKKLVAFESVFSKPDETQKALDFVLKRAAELGFKTRITSQKDVGIIELGQGKETVGILVHVDVVEAGDLEKWTHPPYECVEKDGYLWGRGTIDDKGPVIMSLYALKALVDLQIPLKKKIQLIVGTAEETQWTDMEHFKEQFPCPDYGFSPDGEFPISHGENGYADVEILFKEPKLKQIIKLQAGDSPNTIPSKAVIQFEGGEKMVFEGISAHSSVPETGDNAIGKMCLALVEKQEYNFIRFINDFLAKDYFAKRLRIDGEPTELEESSVRSKGSPVDSYGDSVETKGRSMESQDGLLETTVVPTILRLTEDGLLLNINIRQKPGVTEQDIRQAFDKHSENYSYTYHIGECQDGMIVNKNFRPLQQMKQAAEVYDCDGSFVMGRGTSYAKAMDNFVSWGPVFPDEEDTCHKENERLCIERMVLAAKIYALYLAWEGGDLKGDLR